MSERYALTASVDKCPECGFAIECSWAAGDTPVMAAPVAGDWTVCGGCAAALRFDSSLRLRSTTIAERSGPDAPPELMDLVTAVSLLGQRERWPEPAPEDKARLLVESISHALASGVVHRNSAGKVLGTVVEVLECLRSEGGVECEE